MDTVAEPSPSGEPAGNSGEPTISYKFVVLGFFAHPASPPFPEDEFQHPPLGPRAPSGPGQGGNLVEQLRNNSANVSNLAINLVPPPPKKIEQLKLASYEPLKKVITVEKGPAPAGSSWQAPNGESLAERKKRLHLLTQRYRKAHTCLKKALNAPDSEYNIAMAKDVLTHDYVLGGDPTEEQLGEALDVLTRGACMKGAYGLVKSGGNLSADGQRFNCYLVCRQAVQYRGMGREKVRVTGTTKETEKSKLCSFKVLKSHLLSFTACQLTDNSL